MSKLRTAIAKPIAARYADGSPATIRWQNIENAFEFDGRLASVEQPGSESLYQTVLFTSDCPAYADIKAIRWKVRASYEGPGGAGLLAAAYLIGWMEEGRRVTRSQTHGLGYAITFLDSAMSEHVAEFPARWLEVFNENKTARRLFDLQIRTYLPSGDEGPGTFWIDGIQLEFDYLLPENQLHPDFVAPNYAVNKRSEVFVPSAKAKYFLFKERAWKVEEAPVMSSDLSIRTTALQDDRFLVVDGEAGNAWVFDPALNAWISTSAPQINDRRQFTLTVLQDGRVLLWGGKEDAEIYDPVEESWETSYAEASARENHTSTLLNDGRVVIAGGLAIGNPTENLLVYNLYTNSIKQVSFPPLFNHCAVLLPNGKVLFYGGWNETQGKANEKVYVFDPDSLTIEELVGAPSLAGATSQVFFKDRIFFPLFKDESRGWYYNFLTDTWTEEPSDPETLFISGALGAAKLEDGSVLLFSADSSLSYAFTPRELRGEKPIRLNGMYIVKSTPTPYVLVVETGVTEAPFSGVDTTNATLSSFQAEGSGSYIYDEDLPAITSIQTTLTKPILAGRPYSTIEVADASLFPDEKGYLVFAFGKEEAIYPIGYRNRPKSNLLVLDGTVTFPRTLPIGETVTYAIGKAAKEITNRPFYVTASTAGRIAAQKLIDSITAAGAKINVEVRYPGINGLMDEDKEWIWGE